MKGRSVSVKGLEPSRQDTKKAVSVRWTAYALLFLGLSCGVPFFIYRQVGAQSFSINQHLWSWPVISALVLLLTIYFVSDALRLHFILKASGHNLAAGNLGKLTFINILFSNITPMATGGGFAQVWFLYRRGVSIGTATAATTIRTFIAMFLIFLPIPFLVAGMPYFRDGGMMTSVGWILASVAIGYLACFLVLLFRLRWLLRLFDLAAKGLVWLRLTSHERTRRIKAKFLREAVRFSRCLKIYVRGDRIDVFLSVFFTFIFLLSLFSFPSVLFWGAGYQTNYFTTTGLLVVSTCIMYFAPSPGGAGFAEGVFGLFFASLIHASELVGIILVWRFLTIYLGMLIGIPVTLHELTRWRIGNG
ncbi:conserved membrane protein of unknown function [Pseudodesulfovibrio profundus]|jgi:uncharacterized protein (TIRG00374 family)|uniref:TIGR00374 family protein n=1 Tax=Pseudodesulfovibrio profundus TaxID=57320 RepID=A0A2C8F5W7_9BACT|nr:conserved membrane protein of unknown function [Pseudodesulfovibrio profundus]